MSRLSIRNLWKRYGDRTVLEHVNLEIEHREFCAVVGPSGCGKSTFLKILSGQERPTHGTVLLDDEPLPDEPEREHGIAFLHYSVLPHLTVLENAMLRLELAHARLGGRLLGAQRRAAMMRADEMLHAVGLQSARDKLPDTLSGDMQRRLAIAQSLVMQPEILLVNEPFDTLDPGLRSDMHRLIANLWTQGDMIVFMISNDLHEAFSHGSRMLVFDKLQRDPRERAADGATLTYDIRLDHKDSVPAHVLGIAQPAFHAASVPAIAGKM